MKKIIVTGANGQLGSEIRLLAKHYLNFDFDFVDRDDFSLEDDNSIIAYFDKSQPDFCINCAAYTAVDKAESEEEIADLVNHKAVAVIAAWCAKNDCKLIHISTDYVFDGNSPLPLSEDQVTQPQNIYGATKLAGEKACIANDPDSIIIRTAWVYSEFGANFVKTMLRLMKEREVIGVVNDQVGSPTYAADLAKVILAIIADVDWKHGIYHYSNEGEISWFDFAVAIKELISSECVVNSVSTAEYPTPAKRPPYSLLNKNKIKKVYGIEIPNYKDSLRHCLTRLEVVK